MPKKKEETAAAEPIEEEAMPAEEETTEKKRKKDKKQDDEELKGPLCKLVHADVLKKHFREYQALVENPKYICKKCGRAAAHKKNLCKPESIG